MADGYTRIKRGKRNGVFAAQAGSGDRERLSRHRPGLFRERAAAGHSGRVAAGTAIPAADVPRRRCLSAGHQVVGAGAYGRGTAGADASRLSRHAQRQGRAGPDRNSGRGMGGRIPRRARLHAGAGAALGAGSRRGQGGRQDAARGEKPGAVGRAGRALCGGERPARGARRADPGAGGHHQSGQERDP